jgi:oxalate decarboxylase
MAVLDQGQRDDDGFNTEPNPMTIGAGDIGYVKRNFGHYIKNSSDADLDVLEVFRAQQLIDVSLSDWITHTLPESPPEMAAQA